MEKYQIYEIKSPVKKVYNWIKNIPPSVDLGSDTNIMLKYFDSKSFTIELIRLNAKLTSPKLAPRLFGKIERKNEQETILRTKVESSPWIYISFFVSILGGLISLGNFFFFNGHLENLLWAILMIVLIPLYLAWFKNIRDIAITENFLDYISKKFSE